MEPELTTSNPSEERGCARCGLVSDYSQPVIPVVPPDGPYAGLELFADRTRADGTRRKGASLPRPQPAATRLSRLHATPFTAPCRSLPPAGFLFASTSEDGLETVPSTPSRRSAVADTSALWILFPGNSSRRGWTRGQNASLSITDGSIEQRSSSHSRMGRDHATSVRPWTCCSSRTQLLSPGQLAVDEERYQATALARLSLVRTHVLLRDAFDSQPCDRLSWPPFPPITRPRPNLEPRSTAGMEGAVRSTVVYGLGCARPCGNSCASVRTPSRCKANGGGWNKQLDNGMGLAPRRPPWRVRDVSSV